MDKLDEVQVLVQQQVEEAGRCRIATVGLWGHLKHSALDQVGGCQSVMPLRLVDPHIEAVTLIGRAPDSPEPGHILT